MLSPGHVAVADRVPRRPRGCRGPARAEPRGGGRATAGSRSSAPMTVPHFTGVVLCGGRSPAWAGTRRCSRSRCARWPDGWPTRWPRRGQTEVLALGGDRSRAGGARARRAPGRLARRRPPPGHPDRPARLASHPLVLVLPATSWPPSPADAGRWSRALAGRPGARRGGPRGRRATTSGPTRRGGRSARPRLQAARDAGLPVPRAGRRRTSPRVELALSRPPALADADTPADLPSGRNRRGGAPG